jgi:hypothetical protein
MRSVKTPRPPKIIKNGKKKKLARPKRQERRLSMRASWKWAL